MKTLLLSTIILMAGPGDGQGLIIANVNREAITKDEILERFGPASGR